MQGQVNVEYYKNNNCFDDIKSAVEQLMTASEEQFESIKKEKWYNRLWDMVTFSKKSEIRLAEQISTLSKAQQLFMEILARISEKDVKVAELIRNNSENIKKLSENNIYLLTHVKRLERIYLGITTVNDPAILSVEESKLLSAFIYILSCKNNDPSDFQKTYLNNLLDHIKSEGITTDANNVYVQIEEGSEQLKEITLRCAYEYLILSDKKLNITEEEQEIIDQLDIGKKTTQRIINEVSIALHSRGCEGIAKKFHDESFEKNLPLFFDLEIEELEQNKQSSDISQEYSGLPLKFVEDKKIFKSVACFETKDYFLWITKRDWDYQFNCYNKKTDVETEISAITPEAVQSIVNNSHWRNVKSIADYEKNMIYYICDNKLYQLNIENNICVEYNNAICDDKISFSQLNKNNIVMCSDDNLYCFDTENETFSEITDSCGKSISNTRDTVVALNDNIYFYSRSGSILCGDDGGGLTNTIAKYDIKNKTVSRVISANVHKMFVALGEIYAIASQDNDYDNYYLFKLIEQEGSYILKDLIKFPISEVRVSENYLLYYINSNIWSKDNDLYSIYAFDFRKQDCKKVVENCCLHRDEGIIKPKYIKQKSSFKTLGNWVYYIKDHLVLQMKGPTLLEHHIHRVNINLPLQDVDLGRRSDY